MTVVMLAVLALGIAAGYVWGYEIAKADEYERRAKFLHSIHSMRRSQAVWVVLELYGRHMNAPATHVIDKWIRRGERP